MAELTNALNRILAWTEKNFPDELQYLQPGLSKTEIDELTKDMPFPLPSEVYELYQWRNGTRQGDNDWEKAWIFKGWTFISLENMVARYRNSLRINNPISPHTIDYTKLNLYSDNFFEFRLFFNIELRVEGSIWINDNLDHCPVIFEEIEEGVLYIVEKYASLTGMMLTIAEWYETGQYALNSYFTGWDPRETPIWCKYNSELIEFALQGLAQRSISNVDWIYFIYEIVEFKDSRFVELLIEWLQDLLYANKDSYHLTKNRSVFDSKLYKINMENFDYFYLESGLPKILGELGNIRAVSVLITALKNDELYKSYGYCSRLCSAKSLGQLKDNAATIPLIEALRDDSDEVRKTAAWALGEIGDTQAVESLLQALEDNDKEVREAAREALSKLIAASPEIEDNIPF